MKKLCLILLFLFALAAITANSQEYTVTLSTNNIAVRDMITVSWDTGTNKPPYGDYVVLYPADATNNTPPMSGFPKFTARTSNPAKKVIIGITGTYEFRYVRRISNGFFTPSTYETLAVSETLEVREPVENPENITNFPSSGENIVALGDSLTLGIGSTEDEDYVSELMRRLGCPQKYIINAGVSGDTTARALARLQTDVLVHNPKLVIVWLGANDAKNRVPKDVTYANLKSIVTSCHDAGAIVVLVGFYQRTSSFYYRFNDVADIQKQIAAETGCAYVPNIMLGILGSYRLTSDVIHPNDAGYDIVAKRLAPTVSLLLESSNQSTLGISMSDGRVQMSMRLVSGRRYEILASGSLPDWSPIARVWGDGNFVFEVVPEGKQFFYGTRVMPSDEEPWEMPEEEISPFDEETDSLLD